MIVIGLKCREKYSILSSSKVLPHLLIIKTFTITRELKASMIWDRRKNGRKDVNTHTTVNSLYFWIQGKYLGAKEMNASVVEFPSQKQQSDILKYYTFQFLFAPQMRIVLKGQDDGYHLSLRLLWGPFSLSEFFTLVKICSVFIILQYDFSPKSKYNLYVKPFISFNLIQNKIEINIYGSITSSPKFYLHVVKLLLFIQFLAQMCGRRHWPN